MSTKSSAAVSLGLGATILYLSAQAVSGPQGLMAYVDLQEKERALTQQLADVSAEKQALEARAARLKPETLDRDYLDERARQLLGQSAPNELTFALETSG